MSEPKDPTPSRPRIVACNQKARQLATMVLARRGAARALTQDPPPTQYPYGRTTVFAPGWEAKVTIRWDSEQFSGADIANLLRRVGEQVGLLEGRPDSRQSAGMGWGLFEIVTG